MKQNNIQTKQFSGSYREGDVTFLLKQIKMENESVEEKEKKIQSGEKHYSEMISKEYEPSESYIKMFHKAFNDNKAIFASDITALSYNIEKKGDIVLVSLARAGTPIGVLIKRTIEELYSRKVPHYSISIIRDRGIDEIALKYITDKHPTSEIIFIDGWTGKGVINRELKFYVKEFNTKYNLNISDNLYVVSDIAGKADFSVTNNDYLIPSSALNSTISGLVSRSILNSDFIGENDFHGCIYYEEFKKSDLSQWFINEMLDVIKNTYTSTQEFGNLIHPNKKLQMKINTFMDNMKLEYGITNINYIKPGIGETTRVLLRRLPYAIILKNINSPETEHLKVLSLEKGIKLIENADLPYKALGIIKEVKE